MRRTEFWAKMHAHFGEAYAESWAKDQVLAGLGNRTVERALSEGEDTKAVWRVVCEAADVPERDR